MRSSTEDQQVKEKWIAYIQALQERICTGLEEEDGGAKFKVDHWERPDGGGGDTRVMHSGKVFEKGGVNVSIVEGKVTDVMKKSLEMAGYSWFACGLSLVLHPINPFVPTVHANFRYFELYSADGEVMDCWFGGGADLTPYYLFEEDAIHFHRILKEACDSFGQEYYPRFKKWCDDYFVNRHRNGESRGIGGLFYDDLRPDKTHTATDWMTFSSTVGDAFLEAYLPIVGKRKSMKWTEQNKKWQEIRRGRYVEFNLIYDRGTLFGLKTGGRTESILMSLPPTVRFEYDYQPQKESEEWKLEQILKKPRTWV